MTIVNLPHPHRKLRVQVGWDHDGREALVCAVVVGRYGLELI